MFDDRVCPTCQVLLRTGSDTCIKCGSQFEPARTGLPFLDWTDKLYRPLVNRLGPTWGAIAAGVVFFILFALCFVWVLVKIIPGLR